MQRLPLSLRFALQFALDFAAFVISQRHGFCVLVLVRNQQRLQTVPFGGIEVGVRLQAFREQKTSPLIFLRTLDSVQCFHMQFDTPGRTT